MVVSLVASFAAAVEASGASSRTFTMPTVQAGDVAIISFHAHTISSATLSGLGATDKAAPTGGVSSRAGAACHVWAEVLTAAHSGTTVTVKSTYSKGVTLCAIYRGVVSPPALIAGPTTGVAGSYTPIPYTPSSGSVLIQAVTCGVGEPDSSGMTSPSGMTQRQFQVTGGTTSRAAGALADYLIQNTEPAGPWSSATVGPWAGVNVELKTTVIIPSLPTPELAVLGTNPSTPSSTDGQISASWSGEGTFQSCILPGNVTAGAVSSKTSADTNRIFTELAPGTYTVAVRRTV